MDIWNDKKSQFDFEISNTTIVLGEDYIVEAAPNDKIWGVGMDKTNENISIPALWKGTNILGWALMEARDKFKTTENKCQSWKDFIFTWDTLCNYIIPI